MADPGDSSVQLAVGPTPIRGASAPSAIDAGRSELHSIVAAGGKPAAKATRSMLSVGRVVSGVRRTWWYALPIAVVAALAGYVGTKRVLGPPAYTARTQLHVAQNRPMILFDTPEGRTDFSTYQRGQIAMLRSRRVLEHAINKLADKRLKSIDSNPDPVTWLETALQADFSLAPEHLRITLKGANPDELLLILNAVRESYLSICVNTEQTVRNERLTELKEMRVEHTRLRDEKRAEMFTLAEKETKTRDPNMVKALRDDSYVLKQQLINLLRGVRASVKQAKVTTASPAGLQHQPAPQESPTDRLQELFDRDPTLAAESAKLAAIEDYLKNRRSTLVRYEQDDDYQAKLTEGAQIEKRIEERKRAITQSATRIPDAPGNLFPADPADFRLRVQQMEEYATELEKQIRDEATTAERLTNALLRVEALREEMTREDARVKALTERIDGLEVEQKAPERTTLLEEAVIAQAPSPDKQFQMAVGAAGGAFVAVFLAAGVLSAFRNRVESVKDLAGIARVVGTIPVVSQAARETLIPPPAATDLDQFHRLADAVDTTRCLVLPRSGPKGYVLLVTSACSGDGKTTVSGQLAGRLARCGYRTLLVDANVRRPGTAAYLPADQVAGYSDVLCGVASFDEAVVAGPVPKLHLLTAGQTDPYTVNDHLDRNLSSLLGLLRDRYDVVVIDGPPVLAAPEAVITARWVNGVLFTARCHASRVSDLQAAVDRVKAVGAPVSGVVLTAASPSSQPL